MPGTADLSTVPLSKRLDILQRITDHLLGITPANGYSIDMTGRVFRGRAFFGDQDPLPMVSILEAPRPLDGLVTGEMGQQRADDWMLLVQGWAEDDAENPTDPVYGLCACCEKRLGEIIAVRNGVARHPGVFRLGGRITGMVMGPPVCRPADQISARAYFYLPLVVRWSHDATQPFVTGA